MKNSPFILKDDLDLNYDTFRYDDGNIYYCLRAHTQSINIETYESKIFLAINCIDIAKHNKNYLILPSYLQHENKFYTISMLNEVIVVIHEINKLIKYIIVPDTIKDIINLSYLTNPFPNLKFIRFNNNIANVSIFYSCRESYNNIKLYFNDCVVRCNKKTWHIV